MADREWYTIPGYEGYYEITRSGKVRSVSRYVKTKGGKTGYRLHKGKELKQFEIKAQRYLVVYLCKEGIRHTSYIHRLLARTFIGPCPDYMIVCHNNGVFQDNRIENLRYDTYRANVFDAIAHGVFSIGKRAGGHLSDDQVREVRIALRSMGPAAVSRKLSLNINSVKGIAAGRSYRHIKDNIFHFPPCGILSMAMFF